MTAAAADRYKDELLRDRHGLELPDLEGALTGNPVFRAVSPEGLLVLTLRGAQLPTQLLDRVYRFRLMQYLQRGWANAAVVAERGLRVEPYDEVALRDFHTLVVEADTGRLRGYGTLAAARDLGETVLGDPGHRPFVIERDYGFRLADHLGAATSSSLVWEGKRLVRDYAMPRSQAAVSVPWWVYLAWAAACAEVLSHENGAVVGDGKSDGAIHQLRLLGFAAQRLDLASLPPDPADLFAPMWSQEERSYPFILRYADTLKPTLAHLEEVLMSGQDGSVRARLVEFMEARA
ncbi:hypothetical protein [Streptomyces sp. NPDC005408]|uniref:hypothetical protein n=1 Tax=Streptomyces sp. NPDC005408 TaxID=3155341 RepID=UPI0033AE4879